jgi:hypothetical protein
MEVRMKIRPLLALLLAAAACTAPPRDPEIVELPVYCSATPIDAVRAHDGAWLTVPAGEPLWTPAVPAVGYFFSGDELVVVDGGRVAACGTVAVTITYVEATTVRVPARIGVMTSSAVMFASDDWASEQSAVYTFPRAVIARLDTPEAFGKGGGFVACRMLPGCVRPGDAPTAGGGDGS